MDPKKLVETGYNQMAEQYLAHKNVDEPAMLATLEQLASTLPVGATVLDLGCGAGVPGTQWLAQRFIVTGVDISEQQLALAQQHVPNATFIKADMSALHFPPDSFNAVVAFYSIIHLPRTEHPALLARLYRWLTPGGVFLATWPLTEWEGEEQNWEGWGATMWWSHYGQERNLEMLREAGFTITSAEVRASGGETWLWVLTHKSVEC